MISNKYSNIFRFSFNTILCISSTAIGSTPAKGSSKRIKSGLFAKHLAISVLLFSPPQKDFALNFFSHDLDQIHPSNLLILIAVLF